MVTTLFKVFVTFDFDLIVTPNLSKDEMSKAKEFISTYSFLIGLQRGPDDKVVKAVAVDVDGANGVAEFRTELKRIKIESKTVTEKGREPI